MTLSPLLLAVLAQAPAAPAPTAAPPNRWAADPAHSAIGFRVRHLGDVRITIDVEAVER